MFKIRLPIVFSDLKMHLGVRSSGYLVIGGKKHPRTNSCNGEEALAPPESMVKGQIMPSEIIPAKLNSYPKIYLLYRQTFKRWYGFSHDWL